MKLWQKKFLRSTYVSAGARFSFERSEGRGGTIRYTDSTGAYLVPYQLGAGRVAFEISADYIQREGGTSASQIPQDKAAEIVRNIDAAIFEDRKEHVVAL